MAIVLWCLQGIVTLALAAIMATQATTSFELLAFLLALMAYHRLSWEIRSGRFVAVVSAQQIDLWFHRLDFQIRRSAAETDLPEILRSVSLKSSRLEELKTEIETMTKDLKTRSVIRSGVEILLAIWFVLILVA